MSSDSSDLKEPPLDSVEVSGQKTPGGLFDNQGICWGGWRCWFRFGCDHGFGSGWLPARVQDVFVTVANRFLCFCFGHDKFAVAMKEDGFKVDCFACSKTLSTTGKTIFDVIEEGERADSVRSGNATGAPLLFINPLQ